MTIAQARQEQALGYIAAGPLGPRLQAYRFPQTALELREAVERKS